MSGYPVSTTVVNKIKHYTITITTVKNNFLFCDMMLNDTGENNVSEMAPNDSSKLSQFK